MDAQDRQIIRLMAWERAKGELRSMLQTYVANPHNPTTYKELEQAVSCFIKDVEINGKHE